MSALHWEARRKQTVIDRKVEAKKLQLSNVYDEEKIKRVAEQMSVDPATPTSALLHRSHAELIKKSADKKASTTQRKDENAKLAPESPYSARIKNRYTSINYVQQY